MNNRLFVMNPKPTFGPVSSWTALQGFREVSVVNDNDVKIDKLEWVLRGLTIKQMTSLFELLANEEFHETLITTVSNVREKVAANTPVTTFAAVINEVSKHKTFKRKANIVKSKAATLMGALYVHLGLATNIGVSKLHDGSSDHLPTAISSTIIDNMSDYIYYTEINTNFTVFKDAVNASRGDGSIYYFVKPMAIAIADQFRKMLRQVHRAEFKYEDIQTGIRIMLDYCVNGTEKHIRVGNIETCYDLLEHNYNWWKLVDEKRSEQGSDFKSIGGRNTDRLQTDEKTTAVGAFMEYIQKGFDQTPLSKVREYAYFSAIRSDGNENRMTGCIAYVYGSQPQAHVSYSGYDIGETLWLNTSRIHDDVPPTPFISLLEQIRELYSRVDASRFFANQTDYIKVAPSNSDQLIELIAASFADEVKIRPGGELHYTQFRNKFHLRTNVDQLDLRKTRVLDGLVETTDPMELLVLMGDEAASQGRPIPIDKMTPSVSVDESETNVSWETYMHKVSDPLVGEDGEAIDSHTMSKDDVISEFVNSENKTRQLYAVTIPGSYAQANNFDPNHVDNRFELLDNALFSSTSQDRYVPKIIAINGMNELVKLYASELKRIEAMEYYVGSEKDPLDPNKSIDLFEPVVEKTFIKKARFKLIDSLFRQLPFTSRIISQQQNIAVDRASQMLYQLHMGIGYVTLMGHLLAQWDVETCEIIREWARDLSASQVETIIASHPMRIS